MRRVSTALLATLIALTLAAPAAAQSRWGRDRDWGPGRAARSGYQDPAFARGYSEGYERGLDDGRDRDRYDAVRHRDYRDADDGYFRRYGPKRVYENNFRAGFRQGYEEGYRDGARRRTGRGRWR